MARLFIWLSALTVASSIPIPVPRNGASMQVAGNLTMEGDGMVSVVPFAWKTCGLPDDPISVSQMSVSPSPVTFSKTATRDITVSINSVLGADIVSGAGISLVVKKRVPYTTTYEKIPCIDKMGSCKYADACGQMAQMMPTCNDWFVKHKLSCHCPIVAQSFDAPPSTFTIPAVGNEMPSWLASGDFQIEVTATDASGKELGCIFMALSLQLEP